MGGWVGVKPILARTKREVFDFYFLLVPNPRPGPDDPRNPGWYGRLHELMSPLSLLNSDWLWQLFSRDGTILLSNIIYDLDLGITAKYSKRQTSFYSMQVYFRFHSLRCSEVLVSPSICTKIRTWRFHRTEEVSNNFSVSWHITHISMAISANVGRDTNHNSTKLVCDHPLHAPTKMGAKVPRRGQRRRSHWKWKISFVPWKLRYPPEKLSFQFSPILAFGGGVIRGR